MCVLCTPETQYLFMSSNECRSCCGTYSKDSGSGTSRCTTGLTMDVYVAPRNILSLGV